MDQVLIGFITFPMKRRLWPAPSGINIMKGLLKWREGMNGLGMDRRLEMSSSATPSLFTVSSVLYSAFGDLGSEC